MYQLQFEFTFRIKGSYFYSAELLAEENLLYKNQQLNITHEPNNPFDAKALQIWLDYQQLNRQTFSPRAQVSPRLKLSQTYPHQALGLSTKLSTTLPITNHAKRTAPKCTFATKTPVSFAKLYWQYRHPKWLLGYVPRTLCPLLLQNLKQTTCMLWRLTPTPLAKQTAEPARQASIPDSTQASRQQSIKLVAKLNLALPLWPALKLAWHLIQMRKSDDFDYHFKIRHN